MLILSELTEIPVGSMTEWERSKETEEFGRAARLYRPLAGMMASRFTKAKYQDNEDVVEVPADETVGELWTITMLTLECGIHKISQILVLTHSLVYLL